MTYKFAFNEKGDLLLSVCLPIQKKPITALISKRIIDEVLIPAKEAAIVEKRAYKELIKTMCENRSNAYQRADVQQKDEAKLEAIYKIRENFYALSEHKDYEKFCVNINTIFLPYLRSITPSRQSRFYRNYNANIEHISNFVEQHLFAKIG